MQPGPFVPRPQFLLLPAPNLGGVSLNFTDDSGGVGEYQKSGDAPPAATFEACWSADAILLEAMGLPNVRYPSGMEIAPQLDLRERLGLYGGVRPIRLYHGNDTPLKGYGRARSTLYSFAKAPKGCSRTATRFRRRERRKRATRFAPPASERVCRLAFELARKRRKVCSLVDKANVLSAMVFFCRIFDEVTADYPDVEAGHVEIDATALYRVQRPDQFDVLVTENMFGDILSDLSAGLVGGMGMTPSGDIGDEATVFELAYGAAPDIVRKGIANPIAMHLSAAMMLDWLPSDECRRVGKVLHDAAADALDDDCDCVLDSIIEVLDEKVELLSQFPKAKARECLFLSATSALSPTAITTAAGLDELFVVAHF